MTLISVRSGDALSQASPSFCRQLVHDLRREGAVLLRPEPEPDGTPLPLSFSSFAQRLGLSPFDGNESAAVRQKVAPFVFTANEAPPSATIFFHHEMAQCATWPRFVLFCCETAAPEGGGTPTVRSDAIARSCFDFDPSACLELERRGVRYVRTLPDRPDPLSPIGKSWKETLGVQTRAQADAECARRGLLFQWRDAGPSSSLALTTPRFPVFRLFGGRPLFFNSAPSARIGWNDARNEGGKAVLFADDFSPLSPRAERLFDFAAAEMSRRAEVAPYRRGDVLLLDNQLVLHARQPFAPPRRLLSSLWGDAPPSPSHSSSSSSVLQKK